MEKKKLKDKENKVLLTGFKGKNNSSSLLLNKICASGTDKLELTNSFLTSEKELKNKIIKNKYKYIFSFGQKSNCKYICIELFANKNDNKVETSFPFKDFIMLLKENSIEYSLSKDAGNFLCNNVYYEGMQYIKDHSLDIKMIFLHIPEIDTKYDFDKIAIIISNYIQYLIDK